MSTPISKAARAGVAGLLGLLAGCATSLPAADRAEGSLQMPPGSGLVDYPLLANYLPRAASGVFPVVVDLDPGVPPVELPGVHAFLDRLGL